MFTGRYEEDFINERMKQLQEWVTRITNHPVVSKSNVWRHFLTCTDEKVCAYDDILLCFVVLLI